MVGSPRQPGRAEPSVILIWTPEVGQSEFSDTPDELTLGPPSIWDKGSGAWRQDPEPALLPVVDGHIRTVQSPGQVHALYALNPLTGSNAIVLRRVHFPTIYAR